jgi:predicted DNA-binding transcriptional regulator YafY
MSQMERIYKLDRLFRRKRPPSKILDTFEISPAQFKRDLEYMRNRLGAPVTFDMEAGGHRYTAEEFNLPGLWFTEREVYSYQAVHGGFYSAARRAR